MAGIHLLREREVVSDIIVLNQEHKLGAVDDLVGEKLKGERVVARESQMERFRSDINDLRAKLLEVEEANPLPRAVHEHVRASLNSFLLRLREKSELFERGREVV